MRLPIASSQKRTFVTAGMGDAGLASAVCACDTHSFHSNDFTAKALKVEAGLAKKVEAGLAKRRD